VIYCHRSPDGNWLPDGASSTGAGVLTKYFPQRNLDELSAKAAKREPAIVLAYPLVSKGERFPFTAPDAEGLILGTPTDEIDLFAALLQVYNRRWLSMRNRRPRNDPPGAYATVSKTLFRG
jgi:D-ribulokinase